MTVFNFKIADCDEEFDAIHALDELKADVDAHHQSAVLAALERIETHSQSSRSYIARLEAELTKRRTGSSGKRAAIGPDSVAGSTPQGNSERSPGRPH